MSTAVLPTEPANRAERIYQALRTACDSDLRKRAGLLASQSDDQFLAAIARPTRRWGCRLAT